MAGERETMEKIAMIVRAWKRDQSGAKRGMSAEEHYYRRVVAVLLEHKTKNDIIQEH